MLRFSHVWNVNDNSELLGESPCTGACTVTALWSVGRLLVSRHGGWRFSPTERHGTDGRNVRGREDVMSVLVPEEMEREESSIHSVERESINPLRSFPVLRLYNSGLQLRNQCQTWEASPTEMAGSDHWWHESSTLQLRHISTLLEASPRNRLFRGLPFEILL